MDSSLHSSCALCNRRLKAESKHHFATARSFPPNAQQTTTHKFSQCKTLNILQSQWYNSSQMNWNNQGWWNTANTVETIANYIIYSKQYDPNYNESYLQSLTSMIESIVQYQTSNYQIAQYFDDLQWWSLASLRVFELTNNTIYLNIAENIFNWVWNYSWDNETCNYGGLWWSVDKTYKNAITNELAIVNACKLYYLTKNESYLIKCNMIYKWFINSGMLVELQSINRRLEDKQDTSIISQLIVTTMKTGTAIENATANEIEYLINDGLIVDKNNGQVCYNNNQTQWSYNQGVILGGLKYLAMINEKINKTVSDHFVNLGYSIIQSVSNHLTQQKTVILQNGTNVNVSILHELSSDSHVRTSGDAQQFKGIYMRYLGYFWQYLNKSSSAYWWESDFGDNQAITTMSWYIENFTRMQWIGLKYFANNAKCFDEFDSVWSDPFNSSDATAQTSALDCFNNGFFIHT